MSCKSTFNTCSYPKVLSISYLAIPAWVFVQKQTQTIITLVLVYQTLSVSNILKAILSDLLKNTPNPLIGWTAPTKLYYRAPLKAWILGYVHVRSKTVSTECPSRHLFLCCKTARQFFVFWVKPNWKKMLGFKLLPFWVLLGLWRRNNNVIAMKIMKTPKHQFQKCQCRTPEDAMCVGSTEHAVVWGTGPFLCYWTGSWTPESWVLRMSAQEIVLPGCYKGQGNSIFHFSFLHVEW